MSINITIDEEERYEKLMVLALDFARVGNTKVLEAMVKSGININLSDEKGNTLLMLSTYHGNYETSKMLLENTADTDKRNDRGQTPLGGVAFKGNIEMVKLLLDFDAKIDANNGGGKTPLMFAAMFGHKSIVDFLIQKGADTTKQTFMGMSAYKLATITGGIRNLFGKDKRSN